MLKINNSDNEETNNEVGINWSAGWSMPSDDCKIKPVFALILIEVLVTFVAPDG